MLVERIPHREGHAEEALAADAPVAREPVDPVLVARAHVRRMPAKFAAALDQGLAMLDRADEPLAAGDDLHRALALLEVLHRVRQRLGLACQPPPPRAEPHPAGARPPGRRFARGPPARARAPAGTP